MRKLLLLVIILVASCGGTSVETVVEDTTTTTVENTTTTTIPPAPTSDINYIELYNSKLGTELCSDAKEIDTTTEECLRQYKENLNYLITLQNEIGDFASDLIAYYETYPELVNQEYEDYINFVENEYSLVFTSANEVENKYIERFGGEPKVIKLEDTENLWNECSANTKIFGTENLKKGTLVFENVGGEKILISLSGSYTEFNDKLNVSGGFFTLTEAKLINYLNEEFSFNDINLKFQVNTWDAIFNKIEILDFNKDSLTLEILWSDGILKMESMNFYFQRFGLYKDAIYFNVVTPYGKSLSDYSSYIDEGVEYIENRQGRTVIKYNFSKNDGIQLNNTPMYLLRIMSEKITSSGSGQHQLTYFFRMNNDYSEISHYEFWRKIGCNGESSVYEAYDVIYDVNQDLSYVPFNIKNLKIFLNY